MQKQDRHTPRLVPQATLTRISTDRILIAALQNSIYYHPQIKSTATRDISIINKIIYMQVNPSNLYPHSDATQNITATLYTTNTSTSSHLAYHTASTLPDHSYPCRQSISVPVNLFPECRSISLAPNSPSTKRLEEAYELCPRRPMSQLRAGSLHLWHSIVPGRPRLVPPRQSSCQMRLPLGGRRHLHSRLA